MGHQVQTKCTYTYVCGFLAGQTRSLFGNESLLSSANESLIGGKDDSTKRSTLGCSRGWEGGGVGWVGYIKWTRNFML